MGGEQFVIRAELAKRVEGVFVEEIEVAVGQSLDLRREDGSKGLKRVVLRAAGEV